MRNRLLDNAPLLRLAVCMIIGIIIAHYVVLPIPMLPVLIGILVIALLLQKYENMQSLAIQFCFLIMGMFLMQRQHTMPDNSQTTTSIDRSKAFFMQQREKLLERFSDNGIDGDAYAVVAAMSLGDKSALTHNLKDTYSVSGASHVLALSGLHLGIIYMLFSLLLPRRRWPALSQLVIILFVWAFVFLVGMSVSVVRSAIMLTVYGLLSIGNRDKMSINALAVRCWIPDVVYGGIGYSAVCSLVRRCSSCGLSHGTSMDKTHLGIDCCKLLCSIGSCSFDRFLLRTFLYLFPAD